MAWPRMAPLAWSVLTTLLLFASCPWGGQGEPIKIDFNKCRPATYQLTPDPSVSPTVLQCCPLTTTKPILEGMPAKTSNFIRTRKASQCTDKEYAEKLSKAYGLMRALPDDDPRSFARQWQLHCSYCGGAFTVVAPDTGNVTGIDIHFSWLFYPWHRYFLYFHERILQSLLGDDTFSLNFWNWDNPFTVGDDDGTLWEADGPCLKAGSYFPANVYGDPSSNAYDGNRSAYAKGHGRLFFPDMTFSPLVPAVAQVMYNASAEMLVSSNLNVMYNALVSTGTTKETFLGRPYHAGDALGNPSATGGAGSLEATAHAGVHFWTGQDPPNVTNDMGALAFSARDPIFFAHHSNIDRLWQVWKDLGPRLGQERSDWSDPDFLNAEFMFYDENKDLRRVKAGDALDTTNFGYVYQETYIDAWVNINTTRCSKLNDTQLVSAITSLPTPMKDSRGYYNLKGGQPFVMVIDRAVSKPAGTEEFLTISGITLNRMKNGGFDVYVNLIHPNKYSYPTRCAEYGGRFTNMAMGQFATNDDRDFIWKQSLTRTFVDIKAAEPPSKVVVTLVPLAQPGGQTIKFTSIVIET